MMNAVVIVALASAFVVAVTEGAPPPKVCPCQFIYDPVCAVRGPTTLKFDNNCEAECNNVYNAGPCPPCVCSFIYLPVCGSDGNQYDSECVANCNGVYDFTSGECPL